MYVHTDDAKHDSHVSHDIHRYVSMYVCRETFRGCRYVGRYVCQETHPSSTQRYYLRDFVMNYESLVMVFFYVPMIFSVAVVLVCILSNPAREQQLSTCMYGTYISICVRHNNKPSRPRQAVRPNDGASHT